MNVAAQPRPRVDSARRVGVLVLVTAIVAAGHLWYRNRHNFFDLMIYRDAMRWWDAGNPLYSYWRPDQTQGRLEFTYPPFAAYVFRPLAWLTTTQTVWVFTVVAATAFGATIWWMVAPLARRRRVPVWFAASLVFVLATALEPIREAFTFGQINFVLWALIVFDLLVLAPGNSRWTGVGIGLATAIKLVPGIFILYLVASRRWRAAATSTVVAVGATLLAGGLDRADSWSFWTDRVLKGDGVGQLRYVFNQSIMGVLARLADPGSPNRLLWLILAVPLLAYGLWRAGQAAQAGDHLGGLALAGITGSLVSPVTWVHHLFWLIPALLVLLDTALPSDGGTRPGLLGWTAVVYATVTFSVVALYDVSLPGLRGPAGFVVSNWDVLLLLGLLFTLPRPRRSLTPTSS